MQYPIFIHKDENSSYGVIVPDLPGCYSAGDTIEEAIQNAHEAIECHIEGLLLDSESIPLKKPVEEHLEHPDFKDGVLAFISPTYL
jgi:predicted RNase H-like HicB family nuclease